MCTPWKQEYLKQWEYLKFFNGLFINFIFADLEWDPEFVQYL